MTSADYLNKPYARCLVPDEAGGYVATIQEFPGCVAEGETANEALVSLEAAAKSWVDAALASGQTIPEPMGSYGYSGKVMFRMGRSLHKQAAERAAAEGTSLNQFLVAAVATYVGARVAASRSTSFVLYVAGDTSQRMPVQYRSGTGSQVWFGDPSAQWSTNLYSLTSGVTVVADEQHTTRQASRISNDWMSNLRLATGANWPPLGLPQLETKDRDA